MSNTAAHRANIIPIVTTAGVIAWALFVANVNRPWGFRLQEKHTC